MDGHGIAPKARRQWERHLVPRFLAGGLIVVLVIMVFATQVRADDQEFEIVVPIDTRVDAPAGSEVRLISTPTPAGLIGETCRVRTRSTNQRSVHPENDLVVEGQGDSRIILSDVEAVPGRVVTATDTLILGEEIVVTLLMGPDGVFSAGIEIGFECPPRSTSTTMASTTTSIADTTISTDATTSTAGPTSTVTTTPTTTPTTSPTSSPPTTAVTTTIRDVVLSTHVLPFTGPTDSNTGLLALAVGALGILLLVGARRMEPVTLSVYVSRPPICARCGESATFSTPHGNLCFDDTRRALKRDTRLWMPVRVDRD